MGLLLRSAYESVYEHSIHIRASQFCLLAETFDSKGKIQIRDSWCKVEKAREFEREKKRKEKEEK